MTQEQESELSELKARLKSKAAAMRAAMEKRGVKPLSDAAIDSTLREFAKTSNTHTPNTP